MIVDASKTLAPISGDEIGLNLAYWYDVTNSGLPGQVASVQPHMLRWPGGSNSDRYHWKTQTGCDSAGVSSPVDSSSSTFDNFMNDIVIPGGYDVSVTVNYGSNAACTGGGDPTEAAAWVADAKAKGYNTYTKYWTVGNEEYGSWEFDLHSKPNDAATYAAAVSGTNGYYHLMKAADPNAQVGVIVDGGPDNWDSIVLANAPYDFVEFHWYAQQPGSESDSYLLNQAPRDLTTLIAKIRGELAAVGKPNTPIMLGEFNSVAYSPGKQTLSIVNALFAGMAFGEVLQDKLAVATWWFGAGGQQGCGANNSSSLYGWQNFGGYDLIASSTQWGWNGCNDGTLVPEGTIFPNGRAFSLVSQFATPGNEMLGVSVNSSLSGVRAYAATTLGGGYALMLFNLNETSSTKVTVGVANSELSSFTASTVTYGKQQYDDSKNNVWTGPVSANLGSVGATATVTLPPWSMTVLKLQ